MTHFHAHNLEIPIRCPNCSDGCFAILFCKGCGVKVCYPCWTEHNRETDEGERIPCHVEDPVGYQAWVGSPGKTFAL